VDDGHPAGRRDGPLAQVILLNRVQSEMLIFE
jgi:hypothetical protein